MTGEITKKWKTRWYMKIKILYLIVCLSFVISACGQSAVNSSTTGVAQATLLVMTHDSFAASKSVISDFETANNANLQFLASGDAGTALNKAIWTILF
jgi:ABC-type thiamine transport system substrate-binding protein